MKKNAVVVLRLVCLALALSGGHAGAQGLYKCVSNGKVSFTNTVCPGGNLTPVKVARKPADGTMYISKGKMSNTTAMGAKNQQRRCNELLAQKKAAVAESRRAGGADREAKSLKAKEASEAVAAECIE